MESEIIKQLFERDNIIFDDTVTTQEQAFMMVAQRAVHDGVVAHGSDLIAGFKAREAETSTGFEEGFAIPHARIDAITKPMIYLVKFTNGIEWRTSDGSLVHVAIFLLIPKAQSSSIHLTILSSIAQRLLDADFKNALKTSDDRETIYNLFVNENANEATKAKSVSSAEVKRNGYAIAITACPAGVAHTYMAAKAIEDYVAKKDWKVKVEKQGANGFEDKLTAEDVKYANVLIIAADVNPLELERFKDIPILRIPVAEPIHDMNGVWNKAMDLERSVDNDAFVNKSEQKEAKKKVSFKLGFKREASGLKNAILTGISFAVPVIVAGTTIVAIITIINQLCGADVIKAHANWINTLGDVAGGALGILLAPILAAYIANAMADKPGLCVGFMAGLGCNAITYLKHVPGQDPIVIVAGLGFLGGLISGLLAGYMMRFARKYIVSKRFQGVLTWFIYPVFGSLIILLFLLFVIGNPIALLISVIFDGLSHLQNSQGGFAVGIIVGMLCVFDMGGPFNKLAWAFSIASFTQAYVNGKLVHPELLIPYASFWAAGIGSGWTTSIVTAVNRKHVSDGERETGKIAWILSSLGISEGAIPFILSDPFRVIPSFLVGGAVSGGLVAGLNIGSTITGGGFITMAGVMSANGNFSIWLAIIIWLIAAIIGCAISTCLILLLKLAARKPELDMKIRHWTVVVLSFGSFFYFKKMAEKRSTRIQKEKKAENNEI